MLMSILEPGTLGVALDWDSGDRQQPPLCQSTIKSWQSTVAKSKIQFVNQGLQKNGTSPALKEEC